MLLPMQQYGAHGSGSPRNWSKAGSYEQHFNGDFRCYNSISTTEPSGSCPVVHLTYLTQRYM